MGDVSGTPRNIVIDGLSYAVPGDANITLNLSPFETEGIPSSGKTMMKMTVRSPNAEGIPILANPIEQETLRNTAQRLDNYPLSIELADGSQWKTTGKINFDTHETEENRASIMMIPDRSLGAWELFALN